jgi:hypothetical protein
MLISDSHIGECANKTTDKLTKRYSVMGLVKPGADIRTLPTSAKNLVETLTNSDVLVFSGDVDIIYINFSNAYLHIFHSYLPKRKIYEKSPPKKHWITTGINISCQKKKRPIPPY